MSSSNQWLIDLSKNESLWTKDLAAFPSMIHFEYAQLKSLAQEGQVYGVLLQCKDTYETILKIPVIMALVIIDSNPQYKDGAEYAEIMKAFLESPMSMGNWENLARIIVGKNKNMQLPENLIEILKRTRKLYSTEITATVSNVVNWRNETIGHGALKFQDDASYQEEVSSLLKLLKEYFNGDGKFSIKGLYDNCYFQCGDNKLIADHYERNIDNVNMSLHVAAQSFPVANYINDCDLKWYLFESFYRRKNLVKYSSYIDGKNNTIQNKYFSDLFAKHVLQGSKDSAINSDYISREEDLILEYLHMPSDYVAPTQIVELLQEKMEEIEKGVITISMERGTGKSAFANQMSGLYHQKPLIKNSLSRCYHVSNAALRGLSDFTNSINNGFRHSFNPADDFWGSTDELPSISLETENPAESMAEFLNFYHEKYQKDYTILIIDGIDEITEQAERILDFIPSKDQLNDGVFIVLTTRFADEETVKGKSKKYIDQAAKLADSLLQVRRHDEINVELLNRYIDNYTKAFKLEQNFDKDALIEKSDYRILYLRAYLRISDRVDLDNTNETKFIKSYTDYILSFYGISQKQTLKEIAVTIALFPAISIKQYQEYLNCQEITYKFVGLFNDLLPLLTITHLDGEDVYEFADAAYADFVIEEYPDVVKGVVRYFNMTLRIYIEQYQSSYQEKNLTEKNRNLKFKKCIFFLQGCLSLWHNAYLHKFLMDVFFENFNIILLSKCILYEDFMRYGYGLFLHNEILNCIIEALYFGVKNINEAYVRWTKSVIDYFGNPERRKSERNIFHNWKGPRYLTVKEYDVYSDLKFVSALTKARKFRILYDYILYNCKSIKNIEKWFWVLELGYVSRQLENQCCESEKDFFKKRITGLINYLNEIKDCINIDDFLNYKIECQNLPLDFIGIYFKYAISPVTKEKLLNYQLKECLFHIKNGNGNNFPYGKSYNDYATESFDLIIKYGYKNSVFGGDKNALLEIINDNKHYRVDKKRIRENAIKILLDFKQPIIGDSKRIRIISDSYDYNPYEMINVKLAKEEKLVDFCKAFCLRMAYEKKSGGLEDYLNSFPFLEMGMETILAYAFGTGKKWHKELKKWIDQINAISKDERSFSNILLYKMMILSVYYLERNSNNESEIIDALEKLVYNVDTYGFLIIHILGRDTNQIDVIKNLKKLIYCTNNALYLLEYLFKANMVSRANKLIAILEESIPIVDIVLQNNELVNYETKGRCEIQKYRFFALRRKIKLYNSFDKYIKKDVLLHKKRIVSFIKNLSINSDFQEFAYDNELLLEFAYQTKQWKLGEKCCKLLVAYYQSALINENTVIKNCINKQIEVLELCRDFMAFMSGKNVVVGEVNLDNFNLSTFWGVGLFMDVESFYKENSVTDKDRTEYKKCLEVGLDDYYA